MMKRSLFFTHSILILLPIAGAACSGAPGAPGPDAGERRDTGLVCDPEFGCPEFCPNGTVEPPEECDDGNDSNTDACLATCRNAACGDGYVRSGVETCDDGNDDDHDGCSNTCVACAASPETCDMADNDCDDRVDEGTAGCCMGVQHCTNGSETYFEYCGDCSGAGCMPGFECRRAGFTCRAYEDRVFYFDAEYAVPCERF